VGSAAAAAAESSSSSSAAAAAAAESSSHGGTTQQSTTTNPTRARDESESKEASAARRVVANALEKRRAAWELWLSSTYERVDVVEKSDAFADFARTRTLLLAASGSSEDATVARAARQRRLVAEAKIATELKAKEELKSTLRRRESEVASDIGEKELRAAQLSRTVANLRARRQNLRDFVEGRLSWRESRNERAEASVAQRRRLREEAFAATEAAKVAKERSDESKDRRDAEAAAGLAQRDVAERTVDAAAAEVRARRDALTAIEERAARGRGRLGQRAAEAEAALHESIKAIDARTELEAVELPRCEKDRERALQSRRSAEDHLARHKRDSAARAARLGIELARRHDENDAAKELVKFLELKDPADVDARLGGKQQQQMPHGAEAATRRRESQQSHFGQTSLEKKIVTTIDPPTAQSVRDSNALDAAAVVVVTSHDDDDQDDESAEGKRKKNLQQQRAAIEATAVSPKTPPPSTSTRRIIQRRPQAEMSPTQPNHQHHFEAAVMAQQYMTTPTSHGVESSFASSSSSSPAAGGGGDHGGMPRSRLTDAYALAVRRVERQLEDARKVDFALTSSLEADLDRARSAETALSRVLAACVDRRDVLRESARRASRASASAIAAKVEATNDLRQVSELEAVAQKNVAKAERALSLAVDAAKAVARETSAREKRLRHAHDADLHVATRHQAQATSEADALAVAEGRLLDQDAAAAAAADDADSADSSFAERGEDDGADTTTPQGRKPYRAISSPESLMTAPFASPLLPDVLDLAQDELKTVDTLIADTEADKTTVRAAIADVNAKWETESVATRARLHGTECQLRIFKDDAQAALRMQRDIADTVST